MVCWSWITSSTNDNSFGTRSTSPKWTVLASRLGNWFCSQLQCAMQGVIQPSHISAGIQLALDFISDCNLIQGGKLSQMACGLRDAFVKTGVVPDESGAYSRGTAHRMARADELSRKQWSPETLDLLVGVNIDVSSNEPDATEDNAEEEAANQVNEETDE